MNEFLGFIKELAPVLSVIASLITVALIPILGKLGRIDTKLEVMNTWAKGHERLDNTRFQAFENRLNELTKSPGD